MALGTLAVRPTTMSEKKMPMESGQPSIWQVARMPEATPRLRAGTLFMTAAVLGAANMPKARPFRKSTRANSPVGEVGRQGHQQQEAAGGEQHAGSGERAGAVAVGERARNGAGDQEAQRHRQHEDAGPERRAREAVAVQRQPDALQPHDQHELHAAVGDRREQHRQVAGGEGADAEEPQVEHRLGDTRLDQHEGHQDGHAGGDHGQHEGVGPAHVGGTVGLDAVGDAGQEDRQAGGEGDVAQPVDAGAVTFAHLAQLQERPDDSGDADRHVDGEDEPPVDGGQDATEDEADERAGQQRDAVDAQRQAALVGGERIGDDGRRVGHDHGPAGGLHHTQDDDLQGAGRTAAPDQGEGTGRHA